MKKIQIAALIAAFLTALVIINSFINIYLDTKANQAEEAKCLVYLTDLGIERKDIHTHDGKCYIEGVNHEKLY